MNIAVVTGASSGLGEEFVKQLDSFKFDEIWVIARHKDKLEKLKLLTNTKLKVIPLSSK